MDLCPNEILFTSLTRCAHAQRRIICLTEKTAVFHRFCLVSRVAEPSVWLPRQPTVPCHQTHSLDSQGRRVSTPLRTLWFFGTLPLASGSLSVKSGSLFLCSQSDLVPYQSDLVPYQLGSVPGVLLVSVGSTPGSLLVYLVSCQ